MRVVVVGAGIIGAMAAWHLQRQGARVTVLDAGRPGATAASFGWVNASFYIDEAHHRLRVEGMAAWRRLAGALDLALSWPGCLNWEDSGAKFDTRRDALARLGYPAQVLDAQGFARLEPQVAAPPARSLLMPDEGAAESAAVADSLLRDATQHGARLLRAVTGLRLTQGRGRVTGIVTDAGEIAADHVLVAAGTGCPALLEPVGLSLPMAQRPALILRTRPVAPLIRHILVSEIGELRQLPDGALLMPTAVGHQGDTSESLAAAAPEVASSALARLQALFPHVSLDWAEVTLAHRPVPLDGLPVVGPVMPGLSVAVLHSGITLGALVGELAAREILHGGPTAQSAHWLERYRPERFR